MFEPEIEPRVLREMDRMGVDLEEYCNIKGLNIEDCLTEPSDDED